MSEEAGSQMEEEKPHYEHQIVLNEDKQYFPDSEKVYPGAEILVNEEDTQDIT